MPKELGSDVAGWEDLIHPGFGLHVLDLPAEACHPGKHSFWRRIRLLFSFLSQQSEILNAFDVKNVTRPRMLARFHTGQIRR
jgi:hypothetical protein